MEIIVTNIARDTRKTEIQEFFREFARHATFEIVVLKGKFDVVVFALVTIPKDRVGEKAVRKLNLKVLNGRRVLVREFQHRSGGNDRRAVGWRYRAWSRPERRQHERRVVRDTVKSADLVIEAYMHLARKSI